MIVQTKHDPSSARQAPPMTENELAPDLLITALGTNKPGLERDWALLIAKHGCSIVMHDVRRFGENVTLDFVARGEDSKIERLTAKASMLAERQGLVVVCRRTSRVPDPIEVRYQSGHTFSMRARDVIGLLGHVSGAFTANGFDIVLDHGQLHQLFPEEVPRDDWFNPAAFLEYRHTLTAQPLVDANWKGLNEALNELYHRYGLLWARR